jgi:hypothetical protein
VWSNHLDALALKHRVEDKVVGQDRIAFNEACEYPDGSKVLAA